MEDDAPVIYGLEFQARALTAQTAETDAIRFLVGTQSLKAENQVHQIDFDEENNIINKNVFLHKDGEIWYISASPTDKNVLATCYNKIILSVCLGANKKNCSRYFTGQSVVTRERQKDITAQMHCLDVSSGKCEMQSAIWQIPPDFDNSTMGDDSALSAPCLELLTTLNVSDHGTDVKCVLWQPGEGYKVISLVDNKILLWDLLQSSREAKLASKCGLEVKGHPKLTTGRWNPHQNCTQIATTNDTCIRGWDLRTMQQIYIIESAHGQLVRDIDFNPNKQYYLASCGDDCRTKFWDIRNTQEPIMVLSDHSHWVWSVRYNHFHDQLVLTCSSDSRVILSNVASISSEPFGHLVEDELNGDETENGERTPKVTPDGVIATYEEHEDSVYVAEWSSADPWLFASLSYDGRLVVNRVPRAEKYRILL